MNVIWQKLALKVENKKRNTLQDCEQSQLRYSGTCVGIVSHKFGSELGLERVLGIDPRVRVFAPQYPTRKGRVLGQLWYVPTSKTISIDLKLDI